MKTKKLRRALSVIIAAVMIFAVVPACALADEDTGTKSVTEYDLWVGGNQVTDENKDDVLGDNTGSVKYDPDTSTLTLNNATFNDGYLVNDSYKAGIIADMDVTIVLQGTNYIDLSSISNSRAIYINNNKNVTFKGPGSLEAIGSHVGIRNDGGNVIIQSGSIHAKGFMIGVDNYKYLTMNGGTLFAESDSYGITTGTGYITLNDGILHSKGNYNYAFDNLQFFTMNENTHGITTPGKASLRNYNVYDGDSIAKEVVIEPAYKVTIADGITNGTVEADKLAVSKAKADAGEEITVTLTATPASGYMLDKYTVKDAGSGEVTVTDGKFTMPKSDVTVTATFKEVVAYGLWVNGEQVTSENAENILGDEEETHTAVYDPDAKTLTLTDATITEGYLYQNLPSYNIRNVAGICARMDLTIVIEGENNINLSNVTDGNGIVAQYCNITFEGTGSIEINAKKTGILSVYSTMIVNDANVFIAANGENEGISNNKSSFTLKGGTVKAYSEYYKGFFNNETVTIEGGRLIIQGGRNGIDNINGTVDVKGGILDIWYSGQAISDNGKVIIADTLGITNPDGGKLHEEYNDSGELNKSWVVNADGSTAKVARIEPAYKVNIAETTNGTVTADKPAVSKAEVDDNKQITVTLTATPSEGYVLDKYTVKDANNGDVTVTDGAFIMPKSNVTVSATFREAEKYDLWVNGEQVTENNAENILGDEEETHTAVYDPETKTLTLTNANITKGYGLYNMTAGIFADRFDLTIDIEGNNNKITGTAAGICVAGGGLVISTDDAGILNISEVDMCGVSTDKDFSVNGAIINVTSEGEGIYAEGNIKIEDGSRVIATSTDSESIFAKGKLSVAGDETNVVLKGSEEDGAITAGGGIEMGDHLGVSKPEGGAVSNDGTCIVDNKENKAAEVTIERLYTITLEETVNGKAEASLEKAPFTAEVTIKTTPASGYVLDKITATDSEGNEIPVEGGKFKMPESDVTVSVTFKKGSSGGGGGGGGSHTKYPVEIKNPKNGTVTVSPEEARNGDKVKIFAVPDPGFEVSEIIVTNKDGSAISVKNTNDGGFTFVMSDSKAKVEVKFKEIEDGVSPETPEDAGDPLMTIKIGSTKYQLNGADMEMDSAPFIDENDRTMLPVRVVANALGISDADIAWDNETKTASFTRPDGKVVSCTVDEKVIRIGDEEIEIDTAPVIRNDRIYLPMRALFNAFNVSDAHIIWNGVNKTVTVTKEALDDIKALAEPVEEAEETAA